jgi:hypothetical protein
MDTPEDTTPREEEADYEPSADEDDDDTTDDTYTAETEDEDEDDEDTKPVKKAPVSKPKELTTENVMKEVKSLLDEYLDNHELEEAATNVQDWNATKLPEEIVFAALEIIIEKGEQQAQLLAKLFTALKAHIKKEDFVSGIDRMLEIIHDLALDIPNAGVQLGHIIGHLCAEQVLPKTFLAKIAQLPDLTRSAAEKILSAAFKAAVKTKDFASAKSLWDANSPIHAIFEESKLQALQN